MILLQVPSMPFLLFTFIGVVKFSQLSKMFFSKSFRDFLVFVSHASFDIFLFEWRSVHYADRPPQDLLPSALLELNYTTVLQLQKLPVLGFIHIDYT